MGDNVLNLLMYADDIVLVAPTTEAAQRQLDVMTDWCETWGMAINSKKSQVLHIRPHQRKRATQKLKCMGQELMYVDTYKYLGYHMHEYLSHDTTVEILTSSARRAFGRVINVFKKLKNMGHKTYESLYQANILSIANYSAGLWGYKEYSCTRTLFNKVGKFYLGTHTFMPTSALNLELDWTDIRHTRWLEMIRLKNRLIEMPDSRWPKIIWNQSLKENKQTWCHEIKMVLNYCGLDITNSLAEHTDIDTVENILKGKARISWRLDAQGKSKLCIFNEVHNFDEPKVLLNMNLERNHRSLVSKLKSGILPLRLETGRYKGMKRHERLCQVCNNGDVEDEIHFLYKCDKLEIIRKTYVENIHKMYPYLKKADKVKTLKICLTQEHLKEFAQWLENMVNARKDILYK